MLKADASVLEEFGHQAARVHVNELFLLMVLELEALEAHVRFRNWLCTWWRTSISPDKIHIAAGVCLVRPRRIIG